MKSPTRKQLETWTENYLKGTISEEDKKALEDWYLSMPDSEIEWNEKETNTAEALKAKIFQAVQQKAGHSKKNGSPKRFRRIMLRFSEVAAISALLITSGLFMRYHRNSAKRPDIAKEQKVPDIQPGITKATLTLANGKSIILDTMHAINVKRVNGHLCIMDKKGIVTFMDDTTRLYSTLVTHRGEQAPPLILADGTKIWVNAASTLHFPLIFEGDTREVSLSGEAYFEVAKDARHPFIVHTGADRVEVLGTHFDVKAYGDEPSTYATLLEGAIRLSNAHSTVKLSAGQQGKVDSKGTISVREVDTDESVAWLHGQLSMQNMDVTAFLNEVSRWYDVNVVYHGKVPVLSFSGFLNKQVPLSRVLEAMSANGVHCTLKGRTIEVSGQ